MKFLTKYLIQKTGAGDLQDILETVLKRYAAVLPDWDYSVISVEKHKNPNDQIDAVIGALEQMKNQDSGCI